VSSTGTYRGSLFGHGSWSRSPLPARADADDANPRAANAEDDAHRVVAVDDDDEMPLDVGFATEAAETAADATRHGATCAHDPGFGLELARAEDAHARRSSAANVRSIIARAARDDDMRRRGEESSRPSPARRRTAERKKNFIRGATIRVHHR
jgi:hypothetical protein